MNSFKGHSRTTSLRYITPASQFLYPTSMHSLNSPKPYPRLTEELLLCVHNAQFLESICAQVMQMDFEEFLEAIKTILLRLPRDKRDIPKDRWPKFFNEIYDACPANHLNLFQG